MPQNNNIFQEIQFLNDVKSRITDLKSLKDQWKNVADTFVKHKWIYRYIDDKQKEKLKKEYKVLTDDDSSYTAYKKSFIYICNFFGIPYDKVIIENMMFTKDKKDKEQWELALKYSKGLAKVMIPDGIKLIHISPAKNIDALIPSFRSKIKGKYMYPSKRVFFTLVKDIKPTKAGLERTNTYRYTPKSKITYAYIDPTYADIGSGSVYIDTENSIPVKKYEKSNIFKKVMNNDI